MSLAKALRSKPIARLMPAGRAEPAEDFVAVEEPLEIRVAGRSVAVVMRTPGHDRELAAGFLASEGLIRSPADVLDLVYCGAGSNVEAARGNVLDVLLAPGVTIDFARLSRNVFTSSSCGVCSKASIEAVQAQFPRLPPSDPATRSAIAALPERLRETQAGFAASGGLHGSALFDAAGNLLVAREDVGRHNAVDKVTGWAFFGGRLPLPGHVLLVSGRVSFEIMQKALAAGIPTVAAISAPTTAAIELAVASGQTLIGFLRPEAGGVRMNVYAGTLTE
jgi:FdhD protein